ncbi:MAG: hypothetical protein H0X30_24260 [Anaerolineae bacterium]|nr:hypothetical protein [Anaerolineae bacterium]
MLKEMDWHSRLKGCEKIKAVRRTLNAWRSWSHITEEVALYLFALEDQRVSDGLNATAPNPIISEQFANHLSMAVLGKTNTKGFPGIILHILLGPAADLLTHGKRIIPR